MFNWCFIGTGQIAKKVAKELVTNPGHQIVSVFNRTKAKAEKFAKIYHSTVYESALEAINDPRVDGVYIATTNETHFSFCKLCLENHKPVLCEKPITGNTKELKELAGIPNNRPVADFLGSEITAYKTVAQINSRREIEKHDLHGVQDIGEVGIEETI